MSWDIFVQDLPATARSTDEIPDDFKPQPIGTRQRVIDSILKAAPFADISDPSWIRIDGHGVVMEISLGEEETLGGFAFHIRSGDAAIGIVAAILDDLKLRALDPGADTGIFDASTAAKSLERWIEYRNRALGK